MNKENTNTATDILNNPLLGYKNVTREHEGVTNTAAHTLALPYFGLQKCNP